MQECRVGHRVSKGLRVGQIAGDLLFIFQFFLLSYTVQLPEQTVGLIFIVIVSSVPN